MLSSRDHQATMGVLWPGDHWLGPLSYSFEGRDADASAVELVKFIADHLRADATINFVAHSLGCRVAMEAADRLLEQGRRVGQVCLLAAALDNDCLADPKVYRHAATRVARVAVLSSRSDSVLAFAYPAGDLFQAFLFLEDSPGFALGWGGPRNHAPSGHSIPPGTEKEPIPVLSKVGHGDYLPRGTATDKQEAAVSYASAVLHGDPDPEYRL